MPETLRRSVVAEKRRTFEQVQVAKDQAVRFIANVLDDPERADEVEEESVEDYAERRGIEITEENPSARKIRVEFSPRIKSQTGGCKVMAKKREDVVQELRDANERIAELEDALGDVGDLAEAPDAEDESADDSSSKFDDIVDIVNDALAAEDEEDEEDE